MKHLKKHYDLVTFIPNPKYNPRDEDSLEEIEVGINYSLSGNYEPEMWDDRGGSPAESPEVEFDRIVDLSTGEEIDHDMVDYGDLQNKVLDHVERESHLNESIRILELAGLHKQAAKLKEAAAQPSLDDPANIGAAWKKVGIPGGAGKPGGRAQVSNPNPPPAKPGAKVATQPGADGAVVQQLEKLGVTKQQRTSPKFVASILGPGYTAGSAQANMALLKAMQARDGGAAAAPAGAPAAAPAGAAGPARDPGTGELLSTAVNLDAPAAAPQDLNEPSNSLTQSPDDPEKELDRISYLAGTQRAAADAAAPAAPAAATTTPGGAAIAASQAQGAAKAAAAKPGVDTGMSERNPFDDAALAQQRAAPAAAPAASATPTDLSLGKAKLSSPAGQAAGRTAQDNKSLLDRLGYGKTYDGQPASQQGGFDYTPTESIQRKHYAVTESDLPYLKAALRGRLTSIVNEKMVLGKSSDASSSGSFLQGESKTKKRK